MMTPHASNQQKYKPASGPAFAPPAEIQVRKALDIPYAKVVD